MDKVLKKQKRIKMPSNCSKDMPANARNNESPINNVIEIRYVIISNLTFAFSPLFLKYIKPIFANTKTKIKIQLLINISKKFFFVKKFSRNTKKLKYMNE